MRDRTQALGRIVAIGLLACALYNACPRWFHACGDALVHLSVAERLANGEWFAFNSGERASASSSFGWSLLLAGLVKLGGLELATWAVPSICAVALLTSAYWIGRLARRFGASTLSGWLAALAYLALPGVMYNGLLGMENGLFACCVLGFVGTWCNIALHDQPPCSVLEQLPGPSRTPWGPALALCAWGAALPLLRPEGWALPVIAALEVLRPLRSQGGQYPRAWTLAPLAGALMVAGPIYVFHWSETGMVLPGSGISRVMAARRSDLSLHITGPIWVYLATSIRLLSYAPIIVLAGYGVRAGMRRATRNGPDATNTAAIRIAETRQLWFQQLGFRLILPSLCVGWFAYSFVTGAAHVARLTMWLFALLLPLSALGLDRLRELNQGRRLAVTAAGLLTFAALFVETIQRHHAGRPITGGPNRQQVLEAVRQRNATTERLLAAICSGGCCPAESSVRIAVSEVQLRFYVDSRIAVDSYDGRTQLPAWSLHEHFDQLGCPDLDAQLANPELLATLEPPLRVFHGCPGALSTQMTQHWGRRGAALEGWRWSETLPGFVRTCAPPQALQRPANPQTDRPGRLWALARTHSAR